MATDRTSCWPTRRSASRWTGREAAGPRNWDRSAKCAATRRIKFGFSRADADGLLPAARQHVRHGGNGNAHLVRNVFRAGPAAFACRPEVLLLGGAISLLSVSCYKASPHRRTAAVSPRDPWASTSTRKLVDPPLARGPLPCVLVQPALSQQARGHLGRGIDGDPVERAHNAMPCTW